MIFLVSDQYLHVTTNKDCLFADMAVQIPSPFVVYNRRYILYASSLLAYSGVHRAPIQGFWTLFRESRG